MKTKLAILIFSYFIAANVFAGNTNDSIQKQSYYTAKTEIENMLSGKTTLNYKRALFLMENAYQNNKMEYETFMRDINFHTYNIIRLAEANRAQKVKDFKQHYLEVVTENEKKYRYNNLLYNWAIYTYLTDTINFVDKNNNTIYSHLPYQYSFSDPMATINWENSQVLSLLNNKSANCFALASLYKIFAERLNTDANLGLAPGHIFITHKDVKGTNYNIEVGTRSFPGTGSIMTLTYTTQEAVKNGIAMRTLDTKQSIALCLVYLAKGYEYKFKTKTDNFIYECAETTLRYDSLNLNAKLLKAEVLEENIINTKKTIDQLHNDKQFADYEKLIAELYVQGYREMPIDMKNIIINQIQMDSSGLILTNHTPKGFQNVKSKDDRNASLSWGTFDEVLSTKPFEQYSKTLFDTKTNKITEFVDIDILYNQYNFDPVVAAWCVDPLASKMPNWSPYATCADNPIMLIDNEGKFPISVHQELVGNAIKGLKLGIINAQTVYWGTGELADGVHMTENSIHFDNLSKFEDIENLYNSTITKYNNAIKNKSYEAAGEALHTIADFYSHSNYIEIYKKYCVATGKNPDITKIPTFSEALNDPELVKMMEKELYTDVSYGGLKDKETSENPKAHINMNLDTEWDKGNYEPDGKTMKKFSGNKSYYDAALITAQKDLINTVNNQQKQSQSEFTDDNSNSPY